MDDNKREGDVMDELSAIGVTAVSNEQAEEQLLHSLVFPDDVTSGPSSSRFDHFMGLPDSIRFGQKTPFEMKTEVDDSESAVRDDIESSTEEGELSDSEEEEYVPPEKGAESDEDDVIGNQWEPTPEEDPAAWKGEDGPAPKKQKKKIRRQRTQKLAKNTDELFRDDGNDPEFEARLRKHSAVLEMKRIESGSDEIEEEKYKELAGGLRVAKSVWKKLYLYQRTGVRWLSELNEQCVGGILADEMGLGKTIQVIAFLRALDESQKKDDSLGVTGLGGCLIVCPATLMQQWVREIHTWMPMCRVAILHSTGSFRGNKSRLIDKMAANRKGGSILVTSYSTFTNERKLLVRKDWHYVILDEGHKIRNPEAQVTLSLKDVHTPYRLILSGSPMQNSLKELWSLIDFVYPSRLGSLKTFMEKFSIPITQGGYANATEVQATTAYKCALVLRDAINPFILRRLKQNVQKVLELPEKNEQVLFCEITAEQRRVYKEYLESRECSRILKGSMDAFVGLIALRKLCNHPDLLTGGPNRHGEFNEIEHPDKQFGWFERSGKMVVVRSLLRLWKEGGHKVLLFSQSLQMLSILERLLLIDRYEYLRMDGSTNIGTRQQMVHTFNQNPSITVFLLTTRVGGLGINLTGANKVLIFDPDWNPSTDAQARERAWRIGQERAVTVYRLICTGTIEEKIYHRQIFKQFLANRILKDPKQRRFFKTNDLHELFSLQEKGIESTETATLFAGETDEINKENFFDRHEKEREKERISRKKKEMKKKEEENDDDVMEEEEGEVVEISDERRKELMEIARRMARDPDKAAPVFTAKSKKKSKKNLLDGQFEIPFLVKQRRAKTPSKEKEERAGEKSSTDDYVLGRLLKATGVKSVLQHDDLVGDKPSSSLIEKEAENVARQAAAAVRNRPKTGFLLQLRGGRRAAAATNDVIKKGAESDGEEGGAMFSGRSASTSFAAAIRKRKRNHLEVGEAGEGAPASSSSDKFSRMAEQIKQFLIGRGGRAHTTDIVDQFKSDISSHEQSQFRAILKKMATFNALRKQWTLLDEFR